MAINTATSLSTPRHLSAFIEATYMLSLVLLALRGVQYPAVAAAVAPGNGPAPIKAPYNPELYGQVATPAENAENNANLQGVCIALCRAGLGGPPCEPYRCSELFNVNYKHTNDVGNNMFSEELDGKREFEDRVQILLSYNRRNDNPSHHARPRTTEAAPRARVTNLPPIATPRRKVCMKLCKYNLGSPLCDCEKRPQYVPMDLECVCAVFCSGYEYQLDGCPACVNSGMAENEKTHQNDKQRHSVCRLNSTITSDDQAGSSPTDRKQIDWNQWCKDRCAEGDGGAACNCDILPLNFQV